MAEPVSVNNEANSLASHVNAADVEIDVEYRHRGTKNESLVLAVLPFRSLARAAHTQCDSLAQCFLHSFIAQSSPYTRPRCPTAMYCVFSSTQYHGCVRGYSPSASYAYKKRGVPSTQPLFTKLSLSFALLSSRAFFRLRV